MQKSWHPYPYKDSKPVTRTKDFTPSNNFDTKGFFTYLQKSHYIDLSQPLYMVPTNLWKGWELILQNICWCWAWLVLFSYPKYFPVYNMCLTETMSIGSPFYFYAVTAGKQIVNISSQFEARKMWWSLGTKPCLCSREQLWWYSSRLVHDCSRACPYHSESRSKNLGQ